MRSWKLWVTALVVGSAVAIGVLSSSGGANATPKPASHRPVPPSMPQIVNPDGSLNWGALDKIPVWEPPGYKGPAVWASALMRQRIAQAAVTPAQVAGMTPAQRASRHIAVAP